MVHYDKEVFGFEGEDGSDETWAAWEADEPEIVDHEAFCGRHSLYVSSCI